MHQETLKQIVEELDAVLPGRFLGKISQLSTTSVAIDFGLQANGYLFIDVEPAAPRLYLIKRSSRELQRASSSPSPFFQVTRTMLAGAKLLSITKDGDERVVRLSFSCTTELGDSQTVVLVAQLTGRSANLFLLNSAGEVTQALRPPKGEGQQMGTQYRAPGLQAKTLSEEPPLARGESPTLSEALDKYYRRLETERAFDSLAANLVAKLKKEVTRREKLRGNLEKDLVTHGTPEEHKRLGDLLLANITTAEREGNKLRLKDYYAEGAPTIEIELDENESVQEAAGESFSRYTKAKRAVAEIGRRLIQLHREMEELRGKQTELDKAVAARDPAAVARFADQKEKPKSVGKKEKASAAMKGMRRYRSSDGYEVIVGRSARDNDTLTFRVARPHDLWLHAGDYPGSHVIVRNSGRGEIPHRTIIEAAQLAAKFSQASKDSKVTIHYTQRKFISKPKGAASGLVRISSFRSITVEPGETMERV
ncbi:MAG: NFACT family protein [Acidobacteriota bacterium]|nr:NFACT family protein [Acidobacteriota bacterium]